MIAILFTIVLYISPALVLLGNLSPSQLVRYADTAVAQVAYPVWGKTGFVIVAAAALLATTSAINATLFSAFNITDRMCSTGILPDSGQNGIPAGNNREYSAHSADTAAGAVPESQ